jgi:hypothetical protein
MHDAKNGVRTDRHPQAAQYSETKEAITTKKSERTDERLEVLCLELRRREEDLNQLHREDTTNG